MKCNQKELAGIVGMSERTIQDFADEGMPIQVPGKRGRSAIIETSKAIPWIIDRAVRMKMESTGKTRENEDQRTRLVRAQADSAELEHKRRIGELAPLAELREILQDFFVFLARQHDTVASRLATPLANMKSPGEVRLRLLDELRGVRTASADQLAGIGLDRRNLEPAPAPPSPDPEPVGERGKKATGRKRGARGLPK
jgi:phage terminase Nu1 subunit (DNA packaging protein)